MKTLHKLLWACCLTASLTACKDDTDTLLPSDELPPLPQKEEDGMVETTLEEVIEEADGEPPSDG